MERRDTMGAEQNRDASNWCKSSYSGSHGECVEVADLGRERAMRDTKHRDLSTLFFDGHGWRTFLDTAKADLR